MNRNDTYNLDISHKAVVSLHNKFIVCGQPTLTLCFNDCVSLISSAILESHLQAIFPSDIRQPRTYTWLFCELAVSKLYLLPRSGLALCFHKGNVTMLTS